MTDELAQSSGKTTEGVVPENTSGETNGSTEVETGSETPTGDEGSSAKESSEIKEPKYGTFGDDADKVYQGYKELETKLGNWKDVEAKAKAFDEFQMRQAEPLAKETPEELPDFSTMSPQDQIKWIDQRVEKRAQDMAIKAIEERISPLAQDVYTRRANEVIDKMRSKYSDFDEHKKEIGEMLAKNPHLAANLNADVLDMLYKNVTYEKAEKRGADNAIKKLSEKENQNLGGKQAAGSSQKSPSSFADAFNQAEEQHGKVSF
jgi:hypothetical protein